jgi:ABC-type branched-subunit amino acid transport system permease subunit
VPDTKELADVIRGGVLPRWRRSAAPAGLTMPVLVVALLLLAPLIYTSPDGRSTIVTMALYAVLGLSLNLCLGFTGDFPLSIAAGWGCGAYGVGVLCTDYGFAFWPAVLVTVAAMTPVMFLFGLLIGRTSGIYYALASFGLAELFRITVLNTTFTGGAGGKFISTSNPTVIPGFGQELGTFFALAVLAGLLVLVMELLLRRRRGWSLVATRDSAPLARSASVNTRNIRAGMFCVAMVVAGLAGAIWAPYVQYISPDNFGMQPTITLLVVAAIGGVGSTYGPILGAMFVALLPLYLHFQNWSVVLYAVVLLVVALLADDGLAGILRAAGRSLVRRRKAARPSALPEEPST